MLVGYRKINIVRIRQDRAFIIWRKRPASSGIPVVETGTPPWWDGTKNVPLAYKQNAINTVSHRDTHVEFPIIVASQETSRPGSQVMFT